MNQELIDHATWFSENYKTLASTPGDPFTTEGYLSKHGTYKILYLDNFDIPGGPKDTTGSPGRVIIHQGTPVIIQLVKELLIGTPAYNNGNFVYGMILWHAVVHELYADANGEEIDELEADSVALANYLQSGRQVTDYANGCFIMFQYKATAQNIKRAAALNFRINQLPPKPELP